MIMDIDRVRAWIADQPPGVLDRLEVAIGRRRSALDVCEHGLPSWEYCEPCNREYKRARIEAGWGEDRLEAMLAPGQATWDLSPNDVAAIEAALAEIGRLRAEVERLRIHPDQEWSVEIARALDESNMRLIGERNALRAEVERLRAATPQPAVLVMLRGPVETHAFEDIDEAIAFLWAHAVRTESAVRLWGERWCWHPAAGPRPEEGGEGCIS